MGKTYARCLQCEVFRGIGKVKRRTIANFSRCSTEGNLCHNSVCRLKIPPLRFRKEESMLARTNHKPSDRLVGDSPGVR